MSSSIKLSMAVRAALGLGVSFAAFAAPVYAQDADESAEAYEEITVTGSRLKRANVNAPTPMVAIGKEDLELTGSQNVFDIIKEMPQATAGTTRGNSNFTVGSSGLQTIDLRNLGTERTLVLVNGRRWVGGVPGSSVVDLNSIPADLIDNVEIITGGASSVYGSDAIAGVVNLNLTKDFEGVMAEATYGQYSEGDGDSDSVSLTMGGNFGDGKGNAVVSMRMDEQGTVMARDRKPHTGSDIFYFGWYYGDDGMIDPAYSSYPPQGRFFPSGSQADDTNMMTFDCSDRNEYRVQPSGTVVDWAAAGGSSACGFNRTHFRALELPLERKSIFSSATYDLGGGHELFAEASFVTVESQSSFEPFPMSSEDVFGNRTSGYSIDNPFVPAAIRAEAIAQGATEIPFIRRLAEVGARGANNTRDTFRFAFGTSGDLTDSISYDWYAQYGRATRLQNSTGQFNAFAFKQALDAVVDPATGQIVCADPIAAGLGCVPINLFGVGAITQEAADWVGYDSNTQSKAEQAVVGANFAGSFDLMSRPFSWAAGVEYREENSVNTPDSLAQLGLNGANRTPATQGEYDVTGYYVEGLFPIVQDMAFAQEIALEAAYRIDDYSTVGSVSAGKIGVNWTVNDMLRLRTVYSESVRAPNINNLYAGQAQTFTSIGDPCDGVGDPAAEAGMDAQVITNCMSIATVAAAAAAGSYNPDSGLVEPGFKYSQPDIQSISGFVGGNPNLREESAETLTAGFVVTPLDNLSVSVDYYDIEIEDVIGSVSASNLINECYESSNFTTNSACSAHERYSDTGKLRYWYAYDVNQSFLRSEGVDVAVDYSLDDLRFVPGVLSVNFLWSHLLKDEYQLNADSTATDYVGEVGSNDDKYNLRLNYMLNDLTVSLSATSYSSSLDDVTEPADYHMYQKLKSITYLDAQARYNFNDKAEFYLGMDNILNEQPPRCPNCKNEAGPGTHYSGSSYRIWDSQYVYGGIRVKF